MNEGDKLLCKLNYGEGERMCVKKKKWYVIHTITQFETFTAYKISKFRKTAHFNYKEEYWILEFYDNFTPKLQDYFYTPQEIRKMKLQNLFLST